MSDFIFRHFVISSNMDLLKSVLEQQKIAATSKGSIQGSAHTRNGKKKYVRRGDVEKALEEEEVRKKEASSHSNSHSNSTSSHSERIVDSDPRENKRIKIAAASGVKDSTKQRRFLPLDQLIEKFRQLNQPIMLFGETIEARQLRLQEAQHDALIHQHEMGVAEGHDIRNSFLKQSASHPSSSSHRTHEEEEEDDAEDERAAAAASEVTKTTKTSSPKILTDTENIYQFFRLQLKSWEQDLRDRPEGVKASAQGKIATKTMKQCKDYIRPLFKLCRKNCIPTDILPNLLEIVRACEDKEFVRANDAYIGLAIGNAAWPIGVTMVGIHERTGRERINSNKQAHVMNNELQRKYLTSVKRLITYCQNCSQVAPSKRVT